MNPADFHKLAEIRIREAKILLDRKCYEGAYYLAGYAVECALKACIAKETKATDFPPRNANELYTHDLKSLVAKAKLTEELETRILGVVQFESNWRTVKDWKEITRYEHPIEAKRAKDLIAPLQRLGMEYYRG
jgi:HEPN domain-containing protein